MASYSYNRFGVGPDGKIHLYSVSGIVMEGGPPETVIDLGIANLEHLSKILNAAKRVSHYSADDDYIMELRDSFMAFFEDDCNQKNKKGKYECYYQ